MEKVGNFSSLNVFVLRDGTPLGLGELLARGFSGTNSVTSVVTDGWSERAALQVESGPTLRSLLRILVRFGVRIDAQFRQRRVNISTDRNQRAFPVSPDLIVVVESAARAKFDFSKLHAPTAFVVIDPYIGFDEHLRDVEIQSYDYVFVTQREWIHRYKEAGCESVHWLPPACDEMIHRRVPVKVSYDVCFVGNIHPKWSVERARLLQLLRRNFPRCWFGSSFGRELAYRYSSSKIAFNKSHFGDLNMRVFEAMAAGSMLLTDRIENGLLELFSNKKDLVCYSTDDELLSEASYYLMNSRDRTAIAERGHRKVLAHHTYRHRAEQIMATMLS